jgi:hypothetical protein
LLQVVPYTGGGLLLLLSVQQRGRYDSSNGGTKSNVELVESIAVGIGRLTQKPDNQRDGATP